MPRVKTIRELRKEIAVKEARLLKLHTRRKKLTANLKALDKEIISLTGSVAATKPSRSRKAGKRGRRARKAVKKTARKAPKRATGKPLMEYLKQLLAKAKKGMRVKDVASAVVKAG